MMVSGGITKGGLSVIKVIPCVICSLIVMIDSFLCNM